MFKDSDNYQEHVINDCAKTEKLRAKLKKELNDLDNATKNKTLLESIFYWYYSKDLNDKKGDNKGEIRVQDLQANEENFFRGGAKNINKIIFIINFKDEPL